MTSMLFFVPLGMWCVYECGGGFWAHALGLLGLLAIHAAIVVHVVKRIQFLQAQESVDSPHLPHRLAPVPATVA